MNSAKRTMSAFLAVCVLCVALSGVFSFRLGKTIATFLEYKKVEPKIVSIEESVNRLPNVEKDIVSLKGEVESLKYSSTQLTTSVSQEFSSFGMIVMDVSLRSSEKNIVTLAVKGVVPSDKINSFVLNLSGMQKLFFVKKLSLSPRVSAVQLLDRFYQVEKSPKQLESLLSDIEKEKLDSFMVEIEAMAVTG